MGEGPVQPGHPHVIEPDHPAAQKLRRQGGLLRHGHVAGAAGGHHHGSQPVGGRSLPQQADSGLGLVAQGEALRQGRGLFPVQPGDQHPALAVFQHQLQNTGDLLGGLARPVDHLRGALAQPPVEVHLGVADVGKGSLFQLQHGLLHGAGPGPDLLQEGSEFCLHGSFLVSAMPAPGRARRRRCQYSNTWSPRAWEMCTMAFTAPRLLPKSSSAGP